MRCIEEDLVLHEALARGIVNHRALARWLRETNQWDAPVDSINSALRRHAPAPGDDVFGRARQALRDCHMSTRSKLCMVRVDGGSSVREALPELFGRVDHTRGDVLRIMASERGFKLLLDGRNLEMVEETLGKHNVEEVERGLTELNISIAPEHWYKPGMLALISSRLAFRGISLTGFVDGIYQLILLVEETDALDAYSQIAGLLGQAPSSEA